MNTLNRNAPTPEERRLIDEALAAGRVTVCPPMTHAVDLARGQSWREQNDHAARRAGLRKKAKGRQVDTAKLARVKAMAAAGKTLAEAAEAERVTYNAISAFARHHGIEFRKAARAPRPRRAAAPEQPPAEAKAPPPATEAAAEAPAAAEKPRRARGDVDKAAAAREKRAEKARAKVRDRRRFKVTAPPDGEPARALQRDDPAAVEGRTRFTSRVVEPSEDLRVLVDGANNVKIGGDVLVGRLKGAPIYTVTIEERATCPRSCLHWLTCYGNHDPHARRWRPGPEFEDRLRRDIRERIKWQSAILVRLHYLGDFYSKAYVDLWRELLTEHRRLHAFGFTAWGPETEIGGAVARLRTAFPQRFMIRHSGRSGTWGSVTIDFPTERRRIGDMVVCPEQADAMNGDPRKRHCGSCALCWQSDRAIVFVEH